MSFLQRYDRYDMLHHPISLLRNEINRTFQRFFDDPFFAQPATFMPTMNMKEEANRYVVEAELPGMEMKDVDIEVHGNLLTIRGERKVEERKQGERMHVMESRYGSFQRTIPLPENANADQITAEHKNGILKIYIPKDPDKKSRKIEIKDLNH